MEVSCQHDQALGTKSSNAESAQSCDIISKNILDIDGPLIREMTSLSVTTDVM